MRKLLILVAIFSSGCTHNHHTAAFDTDKLHVVCNDENNKPITNVNNYFASKVSTMAYADYNRKVERREIHISSNIADNYVPSVVEFVAYHECAHHQLDHIDISDNPKPRALWSDEVLQEEQDADFYAAETYYYNHGEDAYESMVDDLKASGLLNLRRLERIQKYTF